ncbi:hypothetical protein PoB_006183000 [Plakobranchus ocellatus]|uniref:Uncharacterized protein n=1 Tax=Plakobranchus ocellatus TaxID=259542 RepID=A0AAV4CTV1_9GAST|nr:hypothetical protein PoB_006183000 [Plakobranchus ocellatus]
MNDKDQVRWYGSGQGGKKQSRLRFIMCEFFPTCSTGEAAAVLDCHAFDKVKLVELFRMLEKLDIDEKDVRVIRNLYWDQTASNLQWGVGGTVDCVSAPRYAGNPLWRVQAPSPVRRPNRGPGSLRSPRSGLTLYIRNTKTKQDLQRRSYRKMFMEGGRKVDKKRVGQIENRGDLRLSDLPSGQGAGAGVRTRDRMVPADFRAGSLSTGPPKPLDDVDKSRHGAGRWNVRVMRTSTPAYLAFIQPHAEMLDLN